MITPDMKCDFVLWHLSNIMESAQEIECFLEDCRTSVEGTPIDDVLNKTVEAAEQFGIEEDSFHEAVGKRAEEFISEGLVYDED